MKTFKSEHGFTFIELIISVVLLGILVTVAANRFIDLSQSAKTGACCANQLSLKTAQTLYYVENLVDGVGSYASTLEDLLPFIRKGTIPVCPGGGTYLLLSDGKVSCTIPGHKP
jgi:prepilin-type N-terminal cleavage/methylation domain-containing protein